MSWILCGLMLFPILAFVLSGIAWKRFSDRYDRDAPIRVKMHVTAGERLRRRMDELHGRMMDVKLAVLLIGPLISSIWLFARLDDANLSAVRLNGVDFAMLVLVLAAGAICAHVIVQLGNKQRVARQSLQDGLAISQRLAPLMGKGCVVFNDVPADGFNLDHVVIGVSAVFAIETKSRRRKASSREKAVVTYDGMALRFPTHVETKPLEQARAKAMWLGAMLAEAAGEPVRVVPVVALPGWWIESANPGLRPEVWVTAGRKPGFMLDDGFGPTLPESLRSRIAYAISQRYPFPD